MSIQNWWKAAAIAAACVFGLFNSVGSAAVITFSPDGTVASATSITGLDFSPGSSVAKGVFSSAPTVGTTFTLLYQATLANLLTPTSPFQQPVTAETITVTAEFQEQITGIAAVGGTQVFTFGTAAGGTNQVNIYFNPSPGAANNQTGTGFNPSGPGTALIFSGTVNSSTATGSMSFLSTTSNFNQYGPTATSDSKFYDSVTNKSLQTLTGFGSLNVYVTPNIVNSSFFMLPPNTGLAFSFVNGNNSVPFTSVAPSDKFFTGYSPNLGSISTGVNGLYGTGGTDVQFQSDANATFTVTPEPASLSVWGMLGATCFAGRLVRKRRRAA